MSTGSHDSPSIFASKNYANHLKNLLKPRLILSQSESLNIVARLQGAKDWNTFVACGGVGFGSSFNQPTSIDFDSYPVYNELKVYLTQVILPKISECAKVYGLHVTSVENNSSFAKEIIYQSVTMVHGVHVPAVRYDLHIELADFSKNSNAYFIGELTVSQHSVCLGENDLYLGFPASATDAAFRIIKDPRIDTGDMKRLVLSEKDNDEVFPIAINLTSVFGPWSEYATDHLGDINDDKHTIDALWSTLPARLSNLAGMLNAYAKYAGKWRSESSLNTFLNSMGKILTGEPLYRQVSRYCYETTINKRRFKVFLAEDGPHIFCERDAVQMDKAEIVNCDPGGTGNNRADLKPGLYIAKYGDPSQVRISLRDFTSKDIDRFLKEFGARPLVEGADHYDFSAFEKSLAFKAMKKWMVDNPKLAKELKGKHFWYDLALKQR